MDASTLVPPLSLDAIAWVGADLARPECVLAAASGTLYVADWRGGVCCIAANGMQHRILAQHPDGAALRPNGIALLADGSFLVAHLGDIHGGVFRLTRAGELTPWLLSVNGQALPPTNYVVQDSAGRTWITVSTRRAPRALAYRREGGDGFIVCVDPQGRARVVADGLGYTNEVAVDPSGRWLYVNETFGRRLSRFPLGLDGTLGPRETVTTFGAGTFPDGLAFDVEGHCWIVSIVSNRLIRVAPDGTQTVWIEDAAAAQLERVEAAYASDTIGRSHLDASTSRVLQNISSIAFAGADRRTAVLGCLLGDRLATLPLPVAGVAPPHWNHG